MSSTESISSEPGARTPAPGPSGSSITLVTVTVTLLAVLVWSLSPARPDYRPAPPQPRMHGCPRVAGEFVPSNYTEVQGVPLDSFAKEQRNHILLRLNLEPCPCGCNSSIAACCVNHPQCENCKELARKIVAEEQAVNMK